jgi:hypothetical protein
VEHNRYSKELNTISKYYAKASEFGKSLKKWKKDSKVDVHILFDYFEMLWTLFMVVQQITSQIVVFA